MSVQYVEIGSSDPDRTVDFYRSLLDLTELTDTPWPSGDGGARWLSAGPVLLKVVDAGAGDLGGWRNDDLQRGMRHIGFKVGNVDHSAERVRDAGVRFSVEPTDAVGGVRLCFFDDPDGTRLEFIDGHLTYTTVGNAELADTERVAAERRAPHAAPIFDHVATTVADLDATLTYYRDHFGYQVIGRLRHSRDARGFLITYLSAGDGVLEVFSYDVPTEPAIPPPDKSRLGLRGIGIGVPDPQIDPDGVPLHLVTPR
jgi:catechol 2,3-dioxygenase-like lactoylglutathione lyase family enzyme